MAKRDYYEVLGVDKNASEEEIKKRERECDSIRSSSQSTKFRKIRIISYS